MSKQTSGRHRKVTKQLNRELIQHNYHDYSKVKNVDEARAMMNVASPSKLKEIRKKSEEMSSDDTENDTELSHPVILPMFLENPGVNNKEYKRNMGGVSLPFPWKLHLMLDGVDRDGLSHIVSWRPHGRCFLVHDPKKFVTCIMSNYFKQSKLTSFQRQLNLYGFVRLTRGKDAGSYYHELFLRGKEFLCELLKRTKINGRGIKGLNNPDLEPDFYSKPFCVKENSMDEDKIVGLSQSENSDNQQPQEVGSSDILACENRDDVAVEARLETIKNDRICSRSNFSRAQSVLNSAALKKRNFRDICVAQSRLPFPPRKRHSSVFSNTKENYTSETIVPKFNVTRQSEAHYLNKSGFLPNLFPNKEDFMNVSALNMVGIGLQNGFCKSRPAMTDPNESLIENYSNLEKNYSSLLLERQRLLDQKEKSITSHFPPAVNRSFSLDFNIRNNLLKLRHPMHLLNNEQKLISTRAFIALRAGRVAMGDTKSFKKQLLSSLENLDVSSGPALEPMVKDHIVSAWIDELLHFLALKVAVGDISIRSFFPPGKPVDIAWQQLMLNPKVYANICRAMLGEDIIIDYNPIEANTYISHTSEFESNTLRAYKVCFEVKELPSLFWPTSTADKKSPTQ